MRKAKESFILSFYEALDKDVREITKGMPILSYKHSAAYIMQRVYDDGPHLLFDIWERFEDRESGSGFAALAMVGKQLEIACIKGTPLMLPRFMLPYQKRTSCKSCTSREECDFVTLEGMACSPEAVELLPVDGELIHPYGYLFSVVFGDSGLVRTPLNKEHAEYQALAFSCLRQIFLAFSKVRDVEPNVSVIREVQDFVERVTTRPDITIDSRILATARALLRSVLEDKDELCAGISQWIEDPWGAHGPGAVCEDEEGFEKWDLRDGLSLSLDRIKNSTDDDGGVVEYYVPLKEFEYASRLAIVPKDYRGHRLICIEQKELMFAQQGLWRTIADVVHSHPLTARAIDFTDQSRSMRMSKNKAFCTIDLKDASDRMSLPLLRLLYPRTFMRLVGCLRSRSISYDGVTLVEEGKLVTAFTMGNALCFPIETLTFWALSLATMICKDPRQAFPGGISQALDGLTNRELMSSEWMKRYPLRVFGDDIIVPNRYASDVIETLESCGLVVNRDKTCYGASPVREACGAFWFRGYDTTVVKLSYHDLSTRSVWVSLVESAKLLANSGFLHCAHALTNCLAEIRPVARMLLGFPYPTGKCEWVRWNKELQRIEVLVPRLETADTKRLTGRPGLYAWFTKKATLAVFPRHGHEAIIEKWVPLLD